MAQRQARRQARLRFELVSGVLPPARPGPTKLAKRRLGRTLVRSHPIVRTLALTALVLVLACTPQPRLPEALSGAWDVQQIAGASLGEEVRIRVNINAEQGRITGFTGCNDFSAPMTAFSDAISIGAVREDDAPCASVAAATDETRLLGVLSSIGRYSRHGRSLELLPRETGEALLRLRYADVQDAVGD